MTVQYYFIEESYYFIEESYYFIEESYYFIEESNVHVVEYLGLQCFYLASRNVYIFVF